MYALALMEAIRTRLDDVGGDRGPPPSGRYAMWQADDAPCLWKNTELHRYLRETIRDIGLRQPIWDDQFSLPLIAGRRLYALDPLIVSIESVTRASDGEPLLKTSVPEMQHVARWYRQGRGSLREDPRLDWTQDWRTHQGPSTHYLLDERQGSLSVYPLLAASQAETLRLVVYRGYQEPPTWSALANEATPSAELDEVPDCFWDALVAGVCARAYRKRDPDANDERLAAECEAEFSWRVGPPRSFGDVDARSRWAGGACEVVPNTRFLN
ncbi:MAG: hypothetical protein WBO35_03785 [Candidatus Saccharimonadales bacterium]